MDISKLPTEELQDEYKEKYSLYEKLCSEFAIQLDELISGAGVTLAFPIESRVKTWKSICEKCQLKNISPKEIGEIPDVAGIRIIILFKPDLDKVCKIIDDNFPIKQMEDTQKRLGTNQFGYGSIHYELALPKSWLNSPTYRPLQGLRAEVQVRTASQHIWATASHLLQYKQESDVPFPIRRSINRAAAILEIVDFEFERLLSERRDYLDKIENNNENETLNTDSLSHLLDKILPEKNKDTHENYPELLEDLREFEVTSVRNLKDIITRNSDNIKKREAEEVSSYTNNPEEELEREGIFFTHIGLVREALRSEIGAEFSNYLSNKYSPDDKQ